MEYEFEANAIAAGWRDLPVLSAAGIPRSPAALAQEVVPEAWMIPLACYLISRASRDLAHPALWRVVGRYRSVDELAEARKDLLQSMIDECGFAERRADGILRMAANMRAAQISASSSHGEIETLYGCGQYASESWRIFVDGDFDFQPQDPSLIRYTDWAKAMGYVSTPVVSRVYRKRLINNSFGRIGAEILLLLHRTRSGYGDLTSQDFIIALVEAGMLNVEKHTERPAPGSVVASKYGRHLIAKIRDMLTENGLITRANGRKLSFSVYITNEGRSEVRAWFFGATNSEALSVGAIPGLR